MQCEMNTRSSVVAESLHDAPCCWKFC